MSHPTQEVDFDAGVEPVLVRRGTQRASSMREERADQTDMAVCPDTTGECCNRDAVETLSWRATFGGIKTEQIQVQEYEMFRRFHKNREVHALSGNTFSRPTFRTRISGKTLDMLLASEVAAGTCEERYSGRQDAFGEVHGDGTLKGFLHKEVSLFLVELSPGDHVRFARGSE